MNLISRLYTTPSNGMVNRRWFRCRVLGIALRIGRFWPVSLRVKTMPNVFFCDVENPRELLSWSQFNKGYLHRSLRHGYWTTTSSMLLLSAALIILQSWAFANPILGVIDNSHIFFSDGESIPDVPNNNNPENPSADPPKYDQEISIPAGSPFLTSFSGSALYGPTTNLNVEKTQTGLAPQLFTLKSDLCPGTDLHMYCCDSDQQGTTSTLPEDRGCIEGM